MFLLDGLERQEVFQAVKGIQFFSKIIFVNKKVLIVLPDYRQIQSKLVLHNQTRSDFRLKNLWQLSDMHRLLRITSSLIRQII